MAEEYVKSYEQYSKNIEHDSTKDDLNKLILTLQKMAKTESESGNKVQSAEEESK